MPVTQTQLHCAFFSLFSSPGARHRPPLSPLLPFKVSPNVSAKSELYAPHTVVCSCAYAHLHDGAMHRLPVPRMSTLVHPEAFSTPASTEMHLLCVLVDVYELKLV